MRRALLALIVGALALSASGLSGLVIDEPCIGVESPGRADDTCPPTCLTCGCCAKAAEPVTFVKLATPDVRAARIIAFLPRHPRTAPRDILHVPKDSA